MLTSFPLPPFHPHMPQALGMRKSFRWGVLLLETARFHLGPEERRAFCEDVEYGCVLGAGV